MALITKPDFTYVWASGGAVVAPNDSKKQLGWVAEAPPFQYDNWLQNRQDQMLAHINQRGIPAWDALTNYEAGSLSYVQGSDGKIYKSVAASGPSSVVSNPTTDGTDTYWTVAFADVGAFLTQAAGDVRYTQRSNNLSDLTNVATARTNLGAAPVVSPEFTGTPTAPTASVGTNTTQVATTAFVQVAVATLPFTKGYISPNQTVTNGGLLTLTHGLGVIPKFLAAEVLFLTAQGGYGIGDIVPINISADFDDSASIFGIQTRVSSTHILVRFCVSGIGVADATTGGSVTVTAANINLRMKAWA